MLKLTQLKRICGFCNLKPQDIIDIGLQKPSKGVLTICPTPIGNLMDWTKRQDNALFNADVIACEDTRMTGFLIKLIKQKASTDTPGQTLAVPLDPKECDLDDDDFSLQEVVFESSKELTLKLPQINKEFISESDFRFFKQKRLDEMKERVELHQKQQKEYLHSKDPLAFMAKNAEEDTEFATEDFEVYGITAPFLQYLKNKIAVAKQRKGRGILISCHRFNEEKRIDRLIAMLKMGLNITLVCDAGTPGISDPGYRLVNRCIERNVQVESLPGPSAITVALSASGFPADQFEFLGFTSKQMHERQETLLKAKQSKLTTVLFENTSRLHQLLLSIETVFGEHQMVWLGFELTKLFEKKMRGRCRELYESLTDPKVIKPSHLKGEVTVIIAPYTPLFNEELRAHSVQPGTGNNGLPEGEKEGEEGPKESGVMIRKVDALQIAKILGEKITLQDQEFAELLQRALRLSKNQATKLVINVRHQKGLQEKADQIRKKLGISREDSVF